jgi:hypothetical protein
MSSPQPNPPTPHQLTLTSVILEVQNVHSSIAARAQALQAMGRKQLRPMSTDSLWVFQPTTCAPHSYICLTRQEQARVFILSEHLPTAEQTASRFKSIYTEKVRVMNPSGAFPAPPLFQLPPGFPHLVPSLPGTSESPAKIVNFVAKGFLFAGRIEGEVAPYIDVFELFDDLIANSAPGVFFDPDVYPAVIWLELGKLRDGPPTRTLVYPSGVVVVHGCDQAEMLVEVYKRKVGYLLKFAR